MQARWPTCTEALIFAASVTTAKAAKKTSADPMPAHTSREVGINASMLTVARTETVMRASTGPRCSRRET